MNKSITQATQDDKQISQSIKRFFTRFRISSALKATNAYKKKGVPVTEIPIPRKLRITYVQFFVLGIYFENLSGYTDNIKRQNC